MKREEKPVVLYWDASAVLSALLKDDHSREAQRWASRWDTIFFPPWPARRCRPYCGG